MCDTSSFFAQPPESLSLTLSLLLPRRYNLPLLQHTEHLSRPPAASTECRGSECQCFQWLTSKCRGGGIWALHTMHLTAAEAKEAVLFEEGVDVLVCGLRCHDVPIFITRLFCVCVCLCVSVWCGGGGKEFEHHTNSHSHSNSNSNSNSNTNQNKLTTARDASPVHFYQTSLLLPAVAISKCALRSTASHFCHWEDQ